MDNGKEKPSDKSPYPAKYLRVRAAAQKGFHRSGLQFAEQPRYLDQAMLDGLGVDKINAILVEPRLFSEWTNEGPSKQSAGRHHPLLLAK